MIYVFKKANPISLQQSKFRERNSIVIQKNVFALDHIALFSLQ